jgi:4-cresol dehydrogenase (hydroxylating)
MALPPGISESQFSRILREFEDAVGSEWVFSAPEDVALYRDSYSIYWGEKEERVASAAVAPSSVEEVQAVVRIANQHGVPIYPISTGRNLTYGGSSPTLSGSVVVDLKRMNRILEVDDERNFALVEPGVSYFDLYNYIKENNLKVMMDIPDPGWGSPMGNSLDHGVGYTMGPYRDHFGSHCGLEIVTAEGELIRTGMGAIPNSDGWQEYRYGVGPTIDGLFAQSNFGIVTKMGVWLQPLPETYYRGTVFAPRYRDFSAMVKQNSYFEDSFLSGMPIYASPAAGAGAIGASPEVLELMEDGWPSVDRLEQFVQASGRPAWSAGLKFYGPEETVRANWAAAKRRFGAAIEGAEFEDGELLELPISEEREEAFSDKPQIGVPALDVFVLVARNPQTDADPSDGHADFFAFIPRKAEAVHDAARMMHQIYKDHGWQPMHTPFTTPINYYSRSYIVAAIVPTWRDPAKNAISRAIYSDLIDRSGDNGWGCYRTSPAFQEQVVSKFSYNNHSLLRFQEKLKDSIDPNGIISPGRYGIWPAKMRNNRA